VEEATMTDLYLTSYCNKYHIVATGRPVDHECRTLPPAAIEAERRGDILTAIELTAGEKK
jgi:hypothetical protein